MPQVIDASDPIIRSFLAGRQFKFQQEQQVRDQEDRKLEQDVLKHRLAEMKVTERVNRWKVQREAAAAQSGQDESNYPLDAFNFTTGLQPTAPNEVAPGISLPGTTEVQTRETLKPITVAGVPEAGLGPLNVPQQTQQQGLAQALADQWSKGYIESRTKPITTPAGGATTLPGLKPGTTETIQGPPRPDPGFKSPAVIQQEREKAVFDAQTAARFRAPAARTTAEAEAEETAQFIIDNPRDLTALKDITSMRGGERQMVYLAIKRKDPTFNLSRIRQQTDFLKGYEDPKGRAALNRDSMNNIIMHAADLDAVNKSYERTNARILNMPVNAIKKQNSTAWSAFQTPLQVLKDEIGLYFAGGYAPQSEQRGAWEKVASDTATPAQIAQFARDIIHVGLRRASTHNSNFKTMMGYDDPNLLTPDAVAAGIQLGLEKEVKKFGSGGYMFDPTAPGGGVPPPAGKKAPAGGPGARIKYDLDGNVIGSGSTATAPGGANPAASSAVPAEVQSGKPGQYKFSDGSVWSKAADGSVTKVK
jgi:hypothetical protein